MARTPDVLEDPTPLDGEGLDVRIRVAWLLRMSRSVGTGGTPVSVTDMAALLRERGLAATPPSVSGWETGRVVPGAAVIEGYERALGREPGILRGAIDETRRTFGHRNRPVCPGPPELDDVDRAVAPVLVDGPVAGADWLHFCDVALAVRPGLPTGLVRPLVDRLVSEVSRSVFTAYLTRHEGLALLRCGQYADVVLASIRDYLAEPGTQVVADAMNLVTEHGDDAALELVVPYLEHQDPGLVRGAVLALTNFDVMHGLTTGQWRTVLDALLAASRGDGVADGDDQRWPHLSRLWQLLPHDLRSAHEAGLGRPLRPPDAAAPERGRRRREEDFSRDVADRVCDALGIARQPVLARLVQEATFDPPSPRGFTSALLLMASPMRGALGAALGEASRDQPDPFVQEASAGLLVAIGDRRAVPHATRWLHSGDPALMEPGLIALAHVREPIDGALLAALLDRPDQVGSRALYYAGMTGHDAMGRLAADPDHPRHRGALWWQRHGSVVTH